MKNIHKVLSLLVLILSLVVGAGPAYAELSYSSDTTVVINSINYTIRAGSVASALTSVSDGTVDSSQKIADNTGGFGSLVNGDLFSTSVASIGDLDGDGITDLAVGARLDDTGGTNRGAVYILFMNADGTVSSTQKIADSTGGFGTLVDSDQFSISVASIGDLDDDGITDLAVGANLDDTGGNARGAVYILFMNADGTVSSSQKIADNTGGFGSLVNSDAFGTSISSIGDLDGDGITDLAVGAPNDDIGGANRGAIYILFMNSDGTVASSQKIASDTGGFGALVDSDSFGISVSSTGDLDNDGIIDLAVGAYGDDTGGSTRGAFYILFMNTDGTVSSSQKIADNTGGFGSLVNGDAFGYSVSSVGDLDDDGITDLAVGAWGDDTNGSGRGAFYILFMNTDGTVSSTQKIADNTGGFGSLVNGDQFGNQVSSIGDFNGDGVTELAIGALNDSVAGASRGAVYILFMDRVSSSHLEVTVPSGSSFTLASSDRYTLTNDADLSINCLPNESYVTIVGSATATFTPSTTACGLATSGGSDGGSSSSGSTRSSDENKKSSTSVDSSPIPTDLPVLGCDNRTTGYSSTTGQSCGTNTASYDLGMVTLRRGSFGETVMELQRFLNNKLNLNLTTDGKFGPLTESAVKQWQFANGLISDGLVGPMTKAKMGEIN